jgi:hypothetical protein
MKNTLWSILVVLILLLSPQSFAATEEDKRSITMNIPEAVIAEALRQVLPITLDDTSSRMEGTVTLVTISKLKLDDNQVSFHLDLRGDNLNLVTTVAGQDIRLNLGSAQLDFDCDAYLRFDQKEQILYVRPVARDIQPDEGLQKGDIGNALILFLNGREFPLVLQDIEPIITETSHKNLSIAARITDISSIQGALQLRLKPLITATPRHN